MKRAELMPFEGKSCLLEYVNEIGPQERSGVIYAVGKTLLIFWTLNTDSELVIKLQDVKKADLLIK